jgi:peptidoglycan-associated lipoprotein
MKVSNLIKILSLGLILAVAVGCKHKPPPVTNLPKPGTTGEGPGPGQGEKIAGADEKGVTGGIPQSLGHQGWPENPDFFKADTVYFEFDSSSVKPSEKSKVADVANHLKSNPNDAVRVDGHCDERGTEEYNRSLGERRALALREELVMLGIEPTRVDTTSFGKDKPADTGHDDAAWRKNRRGEFILLTPPK